MHKAAGLSEHLLSVLLAQREDIRLGVAQCASATYGYSLYTYGCSPYTYGCSLPCLRLQASRSAPDCLTLTLPLILPRTLP